jgi:hypothetical protein
VAIYQPFGVEQDWTTHNAWTVDALAQTFSQINERSSTRANQVVIVSVPSLQDGTDVVGRVKIGNTWRTLPKSEVGDGGVLTLPALTFSKAGTHSVKLTLESGGSKYVTVKIKK